LAIVENYCQAKGRNDRKKRTRPTKSNQKLFAWIFLVFLSTTESANEAQPLKRYKIINADVPLMTKKQSVSKLRHLFEWNEVGAINVMTKVAQTLEKSDTNVDRKTGKSEILLNVNMSVWILNLLLVSSRY
jgi:hypothetical protein